MRDLGCVWLTGMWLLSAGCLVRGGGDDGLIGAARRGDVAAIQALVNQGAAIDRAGGVNSWTPLMHALHKNQTEAAIALLSLGADPNKRAGRGQTALMMAAGNGNVEAVRALLASGADPAALGEDGVNALTMAVSGGAMSDIDRPLLGDCNTEIVKLLLNRAPNLRLAGGRRYALFFARLKGCSEILALIRGQENHTGENPHRAAQ